MCGRYITAQAAAFEKAVRLGKIRWTFDPSYNVAPTQQVPLVRFEDGKNIGPMIRWGLVPFFAKGEPPKYSTNNARIETAETVAAYRGPWKRGQRCLQLSAGSFEWHLDEAGRKAAYLIKLNDQEVFGFAGLWDRSFKADGTAVESVAAHHNAGKRSHAEDSQHRQQSAPHASHSAPRRSRGVHGSINEAKAALQTYAPDHMYAYEVSMRVNSPKNNGPALIEAVR
jgi:putative SOS response-associated peptidase YedK